MTPTLPTSETNLPSQPPSYSSGGGTKPKNVQEILEPCSSDYLSCPPSSSTSDCFREFGKCSLHRLADKSITEGIIPPELTDPLVAESREGGSGGSRGGIMMEDEMLPKTLLECILDYQDCIVPNKPNCMADFQLCSLRALEDSRRRRLFNAGRRENVKGPEIGNELIDNGHNPGFAEVLSRNFTQCVALYTDCVDFYRSVESGTRECAEGFDQCSLSLLFDSNLNGTNPEDSKLEEEALETLDSNTGERRLATELYECIRDHMMCLMGADRTLCMGDYQACSLAAMDRARRRKKLNEEQKKNGVDTWPPVTVRPPHGELPPPVKPPVFPNKREEDIDKAVRQPQLPDDRIYISESEVVEGRENPRGNPPDIYLSPANQKIRPGMTPLPGIIAHGPYDRVNDSGQGDPRDGASHLGGVGVNPGIFVVESREVDRGGEVAGEK